MHVVRILTPREYDLDDGLQRTVHVFEYSIFTYGDAVVTKTTLPLIFVDDLFGGTERHVGFFDAYRTRILGRDHISTLQPFYQSFVVLGQKKMGHVSFEICVVSRIV